MLLVLGAVIVSIAIVVGIQLFAQGMTNSNFDSLLRDSISIASNAKNWKSTPQVLGGSPDVLKSDADNYSGASFTAIGYSADRYPRCYSNSNGVYAITPIGAGLRIIGTNMEMQNRVIVVVHGASDDQIVVQDGPVTSQMAVKGGYFLASELPAQVYKPIECSGRIAAPSRGK